MAIAITLAIVILLLIVLSAWWAHKDYDGKIHLVWREASTMRDDSLDEEIEDSRIIKFKLNDPNRLIRSWVEDYGVRRPIVL
jgi:hypothetical protein